MNTDSPIRADVHCLRAVNYSLVQADVAFLHDITLTNSGDREVPEASLVIQLSGYGRTEPIVFPALVKSESCRLDTLPQFMFNSRELGFLLEPTSHPIEVWRGGQRLPLVESADVTILPARAWCPTHPRASAGFVMPKSPSIQEITQRARFPLSRLLKGVTSFADARQINNGLAAEEAVQAIYLCLLEQYQLTYEWNTRCYSSDWQCVRFPNDIIRDLEGTCIDLAFLFAACIEDVYRDPLVIVIEVGHNEWHALVGCWRLETTRRPVLHSTDQDQVRQWVEDGSIVILDPVGATRYKEHPQGLAFSECCAQARDYLFQHPLCYAVDVIAARHAGIAPMPFGGANVELDRCAWLALSRARREAETIGSPSIGARHLLLSLLHRSDSVLSRVFSQFCPDKASDVLTVTQRSLREKRVRNSRAPLCYSESLDAIIQAAELLTVNRPGIQLGMLTERHLAEAILEMPSQVHRVLSRCDLTPQQCTEILHDLKRPEKLSSDWHSSGFLEE